MCVSNAFTVAKSWVLLILSLSPSLSFCLFFSSLYLPWFLFENEVS